jgi:hypothetical protein
MMAAGTGLKGSEFDIYKDGPRLLRIIYPEPSREPSPSSSRGETRGPQPRSEEFVFDLEATAIALLRLVDESPRVASMAAVVSLASDTGKTVLHFGASLGFERFVQELMAYGVDPDQPDTTGYTALHFAALFGQIGCARSLLLAGADTDVVNGEGDTALHIALRSDHGAIAKLLESYMPGAANSNDEQEGDELEHHISHEKLEIGFDDPRVTRSTHGHVAYVSRLQAGKKVKDKREWHRCLTCRCAHSLLSRLSPDLNHSPQAAKE